MSAIILMVGCETNKSTLQVKKAKSGDQVLTVLNHIKFDKREEFNKKWKEYTSKKSKVKPKRSKELDHLTAEFVENKDLEIFDEKKSYDNIVSLLFFNCLKFSF